jgi:hypothetical protein
MCRSGLLLAGLLPLLLAGCAVDHLPSGMALVSGFRGPAVSSADAVEMIVAVLERPRGDAYLDKEVWTFTDEQIVDLEHRALLEDNGFRVGQVVGMTPAGLQSLLTSERACTRGRCYFLGQGKSETLVLGDPVAHCHFEVVEHAEPAEQRLDDVRFALLVQPQLTGDGRIRLHFTPRAQFGDKKLRDFRVAADGSGLEIENKNPGKSFDTLSWDVTVPPNQYVLIGGRLDQPERIGHQCFIPAGGPKPVQRMLVIRTNRVPGIGGEGEASDAIAHREAGDLFVPLALQATWPSR